MDTCSDTTLPAGHPLHVVADAMPDAVVLMDADFKIIYWNSAAEKIYGYPAQDVLGRDIALLVPEDTHGREYKGRAAFLSSKQSPVLHRCITGIGVRSDGSRFPTEVSSFMWSDGNRSFYGAIIRDVSERVRSDNKIREAKEFLEKVFATSPDGILVTDKGGHIVQVNQAFLDMMGYTEAEVIGRHPETFYPDDYNPDVMPPHIEQVFLQGYIRNYETRRRRKDGTIIDVELSISLLTDSNGEFSGMVSCIRNITERKLMERSRDRLIAELQEALTNVKTLSGLLPICASCKRIRNDSGYWQQIESFLHEHSGAVFSHGICPECMEKLYPDLNHHKP